MFISIFGIFEMIVLCETAHNRTDNCQSDNSHENYDIENPVGWACRMG